MSTWKELYGFPHFDDYTECFEYVFRSTKSKIDCCQTLLNLDDMRLTARSFALEKHMNVAFANHVSRKVATFLFRYHDIEYGKTPPKKSRLARREEEAEIIRGVEYVRRSQGDFSVAEVIRIFQLQEERGRSTNYRLIQKKYESPTYRRAFSSIKDPLVKAIVIGIRQTLKPEHAGTFFLCDVLPYVDLFYAPSVLKNFKPIEFNSDPRIPILQSALADLINIPHGIKMRGLIVEDMVRFSYCKATPEEMREAVLNTTEGKNFSFPPWWYYAANLEFSERFITAIASFLRGNPLAYDYETIAEAILDPSAAERVKTTTRKGFVPEVDPFMNYLRSAARNAPKKDQSAFQKYVRSLDEIIDIFAELNADEAAEYTENVNTTVQRFMENLVGERKMHPLARLSSEEISMPLEVMRPITIGEWPHSRRVWVRSEDELGMDAVDTSEEEADDGLDRLSSDEDSERTDQDGFFWSPDDESDKK